MVSDQPLQERCWRHRRQIERPGDGIVERRQGTLDRDILVPVQGLFGAEHPAPEVQYPVLVHPHPTGALVEVTEHRVLGG